MKRFIFLLIALFYTTSQLWANQCAIDCLAMPMEQEKAMVKNTKGSDHSCCHGKEESESQKKHQNNHQDGQGKCFHEIIGNQSNKSVSSKMAMASEKSINLQHLPVAELIHQVEWVAHYNYRPKIPYIKEYLAYKSRINLYILKEQLLN